MKTVKRICAALLLLVLSACFLTACSYDAVPPEDATAPKLPGFTMEVDGQTVEMPVFTVRVLPGYDVGAPSANYAMLGPGVVWSGGETWKVTLNCPLTPATITVKAYPLPDKSYIYKNSWYDLTYVAHTEAVPVDSVENAKEISFSPVLEEKGTLMELIVVWRQEEKTIGSAHFFFAATRADAQEELSQYVSQSSHDYYVKEGSIWDTPYLNEAENS